MTKTACGKPSGLERYQTVHELAVQVGVSDRTVERWHRDRKIPAPAVVTEQGWKLWSPEQVRNIIQQRTREVGK